MLKRLQLPLFTATILIVVSQLINILFLKVWGRIADKFSNKSVLMVCAPLFLTSVLLWAFTAMPDTHKFTIPLLVIIHIFNGMSLSGVTLGTANIAIKLSPKGKAHGYMTVIGIFSSVMGALAAVSGGLLADFFDGFQLNLPLEVITHDDSYSLPIINLKGLDFLFLITFIVGLFSLQWLAIVKEHGEASRKTVIDELTESIVMPLKSWSLLTGVGKLAVMPISGMMHLKEKFKKRGKKNGNKTFAIEEADEND